MKSLFICVVVAVVLYATVCEGARGGRNSMMRRNKQKSRGGGQRAGGRGAGEADAEGTDSVAGISSDYDNRPCIGMCYYRKLNGITVDKKKMALRRARTPCIGLCHRERKRKAKERKRAIKKLKQDRKASSEAIRE